MISFESDYNVGTHPRILQELIKADQYSSYSGYGQDEYCARAKEKIRRACDCRNAAIFFLAGGTQTNLIVISAMLKGFEGVLAANTGHINTHEAGAIECGGHKILELPSKEGKLQLADLKSYLQKFYADPNHEHMVFPGMVFISYPTEYGTLYSKKELKEIYALCQQYNILLYVDGARLGYGLASKESDLTLAELAHLCNVFYIGGTKQGALFGEAVVFSGCRAPAHFNTLIKQKGGLLAKGWLWGLQFDVLFEDNLYFELSSHANLMAEKVRDIFLNKGYSTFVNTSTNQQFIIIKNEKLRQLEKEIKFSFWESLDENYSVIRLVTSWATRETDIEKLRKII